MIDSIVLMTDERTRKSFEAMSAEDAGNILKGLLRHAAGEEIDDSDWSPLAQAVYPLIEGQVDRMTQLRDKNRENGLKGGRPPKTETKPNENPNGTQTEPNTKQIKAPVPEPIPVPDKEKESPSGMRKSAPRFSPPTVDQVAEYARSKGLRMDPERFVDFYASKGWKVGKDPMKDWQAAARNWAARDRTSKPADVPKDTRRIDYDGAAMAMFLADIQGATG